MSLDVIERVGQLYQEALTLKKQGDKCYKEAANRLAQIRQLIDQNGVMPVNMDLGKQLNGLMSQNVMQRREVNTYSPQPKRSRSKQPVRGKQPMLADLVMQAMQAGKEEWKKHLDDFDVTCNGLSPKQIYRVVWNMGNWQTTMSNERNRINHIQQTLGRLVREGRLVRYERKYYLPEDAPC